jgi:hypothetical protein
MSLRAQRPHESSAADAIKPRCLRRVLLAALAFFALTAPAAAAPVVSMDTMLAADMAQPHEVLPHGVPTYWAWAKNAFVSPPAPADYSAFTAWGQVYRCANAPHDPDDVIEIQGLQTWELDQSGWHQYQASSDITGVAFPEDYSRAQIPADIRARSGNWLKVRMTEGYNFHFWPATRAPFGASVQTVVVLVRARLIAYGVKANCVGLSVGGDYWQTVADPLANVTGAGVGRFKRVEGGWRVFSMTLHPQTPTVAYPLPASFAASELR